MRRCPPTSTTRRCAPRSRRPPARRMSSPPADFVAYRTDSGAIFAGLLGGGRRRPARSVPLRRRGRPGVHRRCHRGRRSRHPVQLLARRRVGAALRHPGLVGARARPARGRGHLVAGDHRRGRHLGGRRHRGRRRLAARGGCRRPRAPTTGAVVVGEPDAGGIGRLPRRRDRARARRRRRLGDRRRSSAPAPTVLGTPAQPIVHDGEVFAAWLAAGRGRRCALELARTADRRSTTAARRLGDQRRPAFVASDVAVILNETRSGWAWTVPDGALVPSSQDWSLDDRTDPDSVPSDEQLTVVIDPKPPIAEPDAFGVRAGQPRQPARAHERPRSERGRAEHRSGLGDRSRSRSSAPPRSPTTASASRCGSRRARRGSATLSYAVTDGTTEGGLLSEPTTVALTVAPRRRRTPRRSGAAWSAASSSGPTPEVARGGTVTVPVLPGWVDPEGDPLLLLGVDNPSGRRQRRGDARRRRRLPAQRRRRRRRGARRAHRSRSPTRPGRRVQKPLLVRVSPQPELAVQSFAVVDTVDAGITVDVAPHVTGTTGTMSLESVRVLDDAAATATIVGGTTTFDFSAASPGTFRVDFTVTDGRQRRHRHRAHHGAARRRAAAARDGAGRRLRASAGGRDARRLRRGLESDASRAAAERRGRARGRRRRRSRWMPSARTTSGCRARPRPARPDGSAPSATSISDGTDDRGRPRRGRGDRLPAAAGARARPDRRRRHRRRARRRPDRHPRARERHLARGRPADAQSRPRSSRPRPTRSRSRRATCCATSRPTSRASTASSTRCSRPGAPSLADTATVRVRVLDDDANRAPAPETLEGRVLSGQSTAHRVRRLRHGPGRRRRDPRPHREPARARLGDDLGRRHVDRLLQRARPPRPGLVPLPRRRRASARPARAPSASASSTGSPTRARSPSPTTCRCRRARATRSA